MKYLYPLLFIILLACNTNKKDPRSYVDLQGEWQFALDTAQIGEQEQWYLNNFDDKVLLPGTTDENKKGYLNKDTTTYHLNRIYKYEGIAWYRKEIEIPKDFSDKHLQLLLERTKCTKIWIDSSYVGKSKILESPQVFEVSDLLLPGKHTVTIMVNNSLKLTPYGNVHIYGDDTQTNWNGILGKMYIEASEKTYIVKLKVYPDIEDKSINIKLNLVNQLEIATVDVELQVEKTENGKVTKLNPVKINKECSDTLTLKYELGEDCSLWDEYNQPLYKLTVIISNGDVKDSKTVPFGMREFATKGTQFTINGRITFLRGKHEAAVFPLTGHTPATVAEWQRVYKIAKSYGINHYRFHSYCPPEAAFTAADMEGVYLQAELPFWGGLESDTIAESLREEGFALLDAYANHPSFVMFSHGNEIWSGYERVQPNIEALEKYDSRPLYTMGSNNAGGYVPPLEGCEFFVAARTPVTQDTMRTDIRLTHAFVDAKDGGILNTQTPSTTVNFDYPVSQMNMPVISHEIGQYQIFPDYNEIKKYTGVLEARNLEVFRQRLARAGMAQLDSAFHMATGVWSAMCYKAEMEAAIRTKGMAGFQLLDLQDYPGQGTALVGILDAFMDSKNVISPEEWKQSCNDVAVLLEFPKYCWTNKETFEGKIKVANYSNKDLTKNIKWQISKENGDVINKVLISNLKIEQGGITKVESIAVNLATINKAQKLTISCSISGTSYANSYNIWVFPEDNLPNQPKDILIVDKLENDVIADLQNGKKVLLFPQTDDVKDNSFTGLFNPEFWNYGMFKSISEWNNKPVSPGTMGLLMDPEHPVFNDFPTDFHTNWQWFSIIKNSNSLILDNLSKDFFPIVQVIDNLERNHKLGLLFEFKVGEGKLMVCMSQLNKILDKPEANQLYKSILSYMESEDFNPEYKVDGNELVGLFH